MSTTLRRYILRDKSSGWYLTAGGKHTSDPASIPTHCRLTRAELKQWLPIWCNHEAVPFHSAKEVE